MEKIVKNRQKFSRFLLEILKRLNEPFYGGIAAELGFFFLFSLVPLVVVFTEILGVFSISMTILTDMLKQYTHEEFAEALIPYLSYSPSGTINVVFILLALWAASKAQYTMIRISNYSYGYAVNGFKNFVLERLRAIVTVVTMLFMMAFTLVILVYGEGILHLVKLYINNELGIHFYLDDFWLFLRWPISIFIIFMTVLYNYAVLPQKRLKIKRVIPGALFASVAMVIASAVYSYYVSIYANYDLLYGSLATIVSLLLWFYIIGYILVLGILINVTREAK